MTLQLSDLGKFLFKVSLNRWSENKADSAVDNYQYRDEKKSVKDVLVTPVPDLWLVLA
jgi:hypothetical protein